MRPASPRGSFFRAAAKMMDRPPRLPGPPDYPMHCWHGRARQAQGGREHPAGRHCRGRRGRRVDRIPRGKSASRPGSMPRSHSGAGSLSNRSDMEILRFFKIWIRNIDERLCTVPAQGQCAAPVFCAGAGRQPGGIRVSRRGMLVNRFDQVALGNRFLRPREAAEILGLSPRTLGRRRSRGLGPAYYKFGSAVRYRLSDLNAWAGTRQDATGDTNSSGEADA